MKRYILAFAMLSLFAFGCGGSSEASSEEQAQLVQEAATNDSIAVEMEKVNAELKKSAASLEQLLNELEN